MIHAFRLGPVSSSGGAPAYAYVGLVEGGEPRIHEAPSDRGGLEVLKKEALGQPLSCEPALAEAGKRLGLESTPLPPGVLKVRALLAYEFATGVQHGASKPGALAAFLKGAAAFWGARSWEVVSPQDRLRVAFLEGHAEVDGELSVVGGDGMRLPGVALCDARGALEKLAILQGEARAEAALRLANLTIDMERDPAWAAEAIEEGYGLPRVPVASRKHRGGVAPMVTQDLLVAAALLEAIATWTGLGEEGAVGEGTAEAAGMRVVARVRASEQLPEAPTVGLTPVGAEPVLAAEEAVKAEAAQPALPEPPTAPSLATSPTAAPATAPAAAAPSPPAEERSKPPAVPAPPAPHAEQPQGEPAAPEPPAAPATAPAAAAPSPPAEERSKPPAVPAPPAPHAEQPQGEPAAPEPPAAPPSPTSSQTVAPAATAPAAAVPSPPTEDRSKPPAVPAPPAPHPQPQGWLRRAWRSLRGEGAPRPSLPAGRAPSRAARPAPPPEPAVDDADPFAPFARALRVEIPAEPPAPSPADEAALAELAGRVLAAAKAATGELVSFPAAALEIVERVHDPKADARGVAGFIARDPALAADVVSVANSAAFRGVSEIESVHEAVARLGLAEVGRVASAVAARRLLDPAGSRGGARATTGLFVRAVAVAMAAAGAALRQRGARSDHVWLGGLLHDVGQALALQLLARLAAEPGAHLTSVGLAERVIERVHVEVGQVAIQQWALPAYLGEICAHHHDTAVPPEAVDLHLVRLTSALARLSELTVVARAAREIVQSAGALKMDAPAVRMLATDLKAAEERAKALVR